MSASQAPEIIIAGSVDVDPEKRDAAVVAAAPLLEPTREQDGCIAYVWCADPTEKGRIWVYERWRDEPSLAAHLAGPHYRGMLATIGAHGLRGVDVAKHRVALSEPVYDDQGKPRADFFTERSPAAGKE
ncbi:MAG: putative quinol monooxygenase [Myxococcota bacterium]|nr:putative quinol monooxygenase [Myxococcota bacterium]